MITASDPAGIAYLQGRQDRKQGLPLVAHSHIPDGALWDEYIEGYMSLGWHGPINSCEKKWLTKELSRRFGPLY